MGLAAFLELRQGPPSNRAPLAGEPDPVYSVRLAPGDGEEPQAAALLAQERAAHWAVRMLRNGAPVHVVQAQLGHSTAKLTLDTYGRWLPGSEDRARAEAQVARAEAALTSNHTSTRGVSEQGRDVTSTVATAAG